MSDTTEPEPACTGPYLGAVLFMEADSDQIQAHICRPRLRARSPLAPLLLRLRPPRRRHTPKRAPPLLTHFLSKLWALTKAANASTEDTTKRDIAMKSLRACSDELGCLDAASTEPAGSWAPFLTTMCSQFVLRVKHSLESPGLSRSVGSNG